MRLRFALALLLLAVAVAGCAAKPQVSVTIWPNANILPGSRFEVATGDLHTENLIASALIRRGFVVSRSYHDFGISWSHNSLPGGEGLIAYKFTASVIDQTRETVATASFSGKARLDDVIDAFAEKLAEYAKEREGQERFRLRYQ